MREMPPIAKLSTTSEVSLNPMNSIAAPLAHLAIHDTVVGILGKGGRGALLDVPAGEGALAVRLIAAGFAVTCCDLYTQIFRLDDAKIQQGELNGELPVAAQSFGYSPW